MTRSHLRRLLAQFSIVWAAMKRRALALAAVGLLTAGCGTVDLSSADGSAEGAADATEGIREASLDVAEEEAAAPFFCDGGYGIVAIDATGLHMLTQSCLDAAHPFPLQHVEAVATPVCASSCRAVGTEQT